MLGDGAAVALTVAEQCLRSKHQHYWHWTETASIWTCTGASPCGSSGMH